MCKMNPHELLPPPVTSSWSNSSFRSSPAYTEYMNRELFHVRKFDLVLHHEDGTEYDGTGCFSCFLGCKKPVYPAGQHITGYLLIRPMKRLVITGVAVTFSGQFVTSWEEGVLQWGSQQIFYREKVVVIENRRIDLDCKWYRFDFEYVLPHGLPSSFKEPEAKLIYFATGSVVQPEGPEIETFDTHFHIQGTVDIDVFPRLWHDPTERRISKTYPICNGRFPEEPCHVVTNHSALIYEGSGGRGPLTSTSELEEEIPSAVDEEEEDEIVPQLFAILWLNSQAFVIGEQVTCDVKIENHTHHPVECVLKLEQVLHIQAAIAREDKGRREPPVYHFRKHRKKTPKDLNILWSTRINPHASETVSRIFQIPGLVPTLAQDFRHLPYPGGERIRELAGQRDPGVFIQYFVKLVLLPQWEGGEEIQIPIEIKIGNRDSQTRFTRSLSEAAMTDTTENMERWDVPPSIEDAPPSYDEYFCAKPSCSYPHTSPNYIDDDETIETDDTHIEDTTVDTGIGISHTSDEHLREAAASLSSTSSASFQALTSAPYASQDPSPNDELHGHRILSYDSMLSPDISTAAGQVPMFISHSQRGPLHHDHQVLVQQPQPLLHPQQLLAEPQHLHGADVPYASSSSIHLSPETPSSPRQQLLCNGIVSIPYNQPQKPIADLDNLSGHFTEISLSSPQDSLADAACVSLPSDVEEDISENHPVASNAFIS